jgi:DNA-binding NarL/FixJ family response regulator
VLEHEPEWKRWLEEMRSFLADGPASGRFAALTGRERELVELIAQGLDNAQCAARLGMSDKTVRNHVTHLYSKLEIENRARLIVLAREAGFGH